MRLEVQSLRLEDNTKRISRKEGVRVWTGFKLLGTGPCEQSDDPPRFITGLQFYDQVSDYQCLRYVYSPRK
jgi:hypothetical protein